MGKKQHQSDKMYMTAKEWSEEWGGHKKAVIASLSRLPFSCCALSLSPFEDPVCTADGTCFEITGIVPYIKEHGKNPTTGGPLSIKELIKLNFHKNPEGTPRPGARAGRAGRTPLTRPVPPLCAQACTTAL